MSAQHADDRGRGTCYELPREELLRRARPFPSYEQMVIDELSDDEAEAFWLAITEA